MPKYWWRWCEVVIVQVVYLHTEVGHGAVIGIKALEHRIGVIDFLLQDIGYIKRDITPYSY